MIARLSLANGSHPTSLQNAQDRGARGGLVELSRDNLNAVLDVNGADVCGQLRHSTEELTEAERVTEHAREILDQLDHVQASCNPVQDRSPQIHPAHEVQVVEVVAAPEDVKDRLVENGDRAWV